MSEIYIEKKCLLSINYEVCKLPFVADAYPIFTCSVIHSCFSFTPKFIMPFLQLYELRELSTDSLMRAWSLFAAVNSFWVSVYYNLLPLCFFQNLAIPDYSQMFLDSTGLEPSSRRLHNSYLRGWISLMSSSFQKSGDSWRHVEVIWKVTGDVPSFSENIEPCTLLSTK